MPKRNFKLSAQELNNKVILFHNQTLALALISSGTSYSAEKRNEFVKQAFDNAYAILSDAFYKKDINLFNRIYTETKRISLGANITPEIEKIQNDFYIKINEYIQELAVYIATAGRSY